MHPANLPRSMTRRMLPAILLAAFCIANLPAQAQIPDTVQFDRLTWTEIRSAVLSGKTTIIIPVGGTEQSGPYIAVGKHNVRVAALSDRIARQLGNALVAPVIAYFPERSACRRRHSKRWFGPPPRVSEHTVSARSCCWAIMAAIRPN